MAKNKMLMMTAGPVGFLNINPGTNPTITSYNARVVKIYNATNSIARF
jgi:hypothetical protein